MELSPRSSRNKKSYLKLNIYTLAACILAAGAVVALIFTLWFTAVAIQDNGMSPTLNRGDTVLCDKLALFFSSPKRGDMVCYRAPLGGDIYTGRVIALPNEQAEIACGKVYINGCLLEEDYTGSASRLDMPAAEIEQGFFLLLPDKREELVSSEPEALIISAERIIGRVAVRTCPIDDAAIFR